MAFPTQSLWEVDCLPSVQVPPYTIILVSYVLPPVLGYFLVAALAATPQTHALRVVSWPVVTLLALRAAVSANMLLGEPDLKFHKAIFAFLMLFIIARTFDWTLAKGPLTRKLRPAMYTQSTILDALDLASSLRGHSWDWSRGLHIPRETRPTNRRRFIFHVILSAVFHALVCGAFHRAIRAVSSTGLGTVSGGSIFDETLPFNVRYFRATVISAFALVEIYAIIQTFYDACTIVGMLVLGQDPAQWPPAFDAPWRATSLSDFWGRRWHQFFRRMFLILGGYPLSFFLGSPGLAIGAFLFSGVMHYIVVVMLHDQSEPWRILVGFEMMAPGVLAEHGFKRLTGRKVAGIAGWFWTMAWLLLWGSMIIDGFARAGVFWHLKFTESVVPPSGLAVVEGLMAKF